LFYELKKDFNYFLKTLVRDKSINPFPLLLRF